MESLLPRWALCHPVLRSRREERMRGATHAWSLSPTEAIALQRELAGQVRCVDDLGPVRTIAGVDVSMDRFATEGHAAIVVLSVPELAILEVAEASLTLGMPYIPG